MERHNEKCYGQIIQNDMRNITDFFAETIGIALLLSCSSSSSKAVEEKGGLLWEISGNGLEQSSYLFGTAHGGSFIAATYILDSIPSFEEAFSSVTQFIGESYSSSGNQNLMLMDSTYAELLDEEDLAILDTVMLKYLNRSSDKIKIKPSFLTRLISEKKRFILVQEKMRAKLYAEKYLDLRDIDELVYVSEEPMDITLQKRAIKKGYDIIGLDNRINFQFDTTDDSLTLTQQAEHMISIFKNNQLDELIRVSLKLPLIDSLNDAYYEQDLDQIEHISIKLFSDSLNYGDIQRELLFERNFKWMEHITSLIREQPSFIAVGVRHLPGENGLIDLLRKEGHTVVPL